jgi:6-phosphogluconolactonase (cycloisomerase 2 family)
MKKFYPKSTFFSMRKIALLTLLIIVVTRLLVSCNKLPFSNRFSEIIYVETNDYIKSNNAVIAYRNNGDGKLLPVLGGPFFTGGSGLANPNQAIGPNASEGEIKVSNDRRFLLAVNAGSNTIAVFKILADGTLSAVPGSPFPSGGETPVSIEQWQQYIFVLNKSDNPLQPSTQKPNYTTFMLQGDGTLMPVQGGKFEVPEGSSPAEVLVSKTHSFVFGSDYLAYQLTPPQGSLRSFTVSNSGILTSAPGSPLTIPNGGAGLGICQHPSSDVLYVAFPTQRKVGVYTINATTGALTLKEIVEANYAASWIKTNVVGDRSYILYTPSNQVAPCNSFTPDNIFIMSATQLKNSGPTFTVNGKTYTSSQASSMALSSDDKFLYVVSQHANPDFSIGNYNFLHVVKATDFPLSEPYDPIQLPVPNTVRPCGVAVLRLN